MSSALLIPTLKHVLMLGDSKVKEKLVRIQQEVIMSSLDSNQTHTDLMAIQLDLDPYEQMVCKPV